MKNVIILGSGRSGTSMVAGCFATSGYFMGKDLWDACESNPKGFFEAREINEINEDLLAPHIPKRLRIFGRSFFNDRPLKWQRWLSCLPHDQEVLSSPEIESRIQEITNQVPYCLKDPRFSYTLPAWRPYLKDIVFICVFRDPGRTAQSIQKECQQRWYLANPETQIKISLNQALKVWEYIYLSILLQHRYYGDWLFIHYNQVCTERGKDRLEEFTGANIDRSFPNLSLKRSKPLGRLSESHVCIYRSLCEIAGYRDPEVS